MLRRPILAVLVICGLIGVTSLSEARERLEFSDAERLIGECQISLTETAHLRIEEAFKITDPPPSCNIEFDRRDKVSAGGIGVLVRMRDLDTDENYGLGFVRATGEREQWKFEGTSDLLLDSHILKRSFTQVQSGDETLLVGRQLLRGKMPNGGVTELPGIRILRIAPQFVISAQMNFQPMTGGLSVKAYQQRLDAVSQELIDIVKSIRPTPGQPGPTVRQR